MFSTLVNVNGVMHLVYYDTVLERNAQVAELFAS